MAELVYKLKPVRTSSPFDTDNNFPAAGSLCSQFCLDSSSYVDEEMPSLGLPTVPIVDTAQVEIRQAPTAHPPAVYAQAQDWNNDGVSTLSVDEAHVTAGTSPNQRPSIIINNGHSATSTNTGAANVLATGSKNSDFQYTLYIVLESGRHDDIVSWCEGGMAVLITDIDRFTDEVLRNHFGQGRRPIKFSSFKKQLRRYSFRSETRHSYAKVTKNFYFCNENFQKGRQDLLNMMHPKDRKRK